MKEITLDNLAYALMFAHMSLILICSYPMKEL